MKEGKRPIVLGLGSGLLCSRESARNREIGREREKDRQTQGPKL